MMVQDIDAMQRKLDMAKEEEKEPFPLATNGEDPTEPTPNFDERKVQPINDESSKTFGFSFGFKKKKCVEGFIQHSKFLVVPKAKSENTQ